MAQASKRQTLSFRAFADPWRLQALLEVLAPLLFLQRHPFLQFLWYFSQSLAFYLSLHTVVLIFPKS
jgi:hypothetical protein